MTQGEGKSRGRRGREEGKHWIGWRMLRVAVVLGVMMGWGVSEAWGATVTYHIINLGKLNDSGQLSSTRTEALQFTSTTLTVGLPNQYKSPLAKNWQYYSSDDVDYNSSTKVCVFNSGPSLSVGDEVSDGAHVYVTYELDEDNISDVGLYDGGVCRIKFPDGYYLKQTTYNSELNTGSDNTNSTESIYLWKFNIIDPYQITVQSQSQNCFDYYLCSKNGNFGDIRLKATLSEARDTKVWVFGLLNGGTDGTYRLVVTDGYSVLNGYTGSSPSGYDSFGHGYLNNNDSHKTRYMKYGGNSYYNCDLTFVPLTKTYNIVNNSEETLVQATTTDYPLEVPDVIKSPFATYSYYSDAACTREISAVGNTTTIYVRYTTTNGSLNLNGGTEYYVHTNNNYWYAANATNIGIANSFADPTSETKWTLNGNDAYQLTIKNVGNNNEVTYDVSSGEAVPTLSGTGSKFFLHQSNTGQYEVVAVSSGDYTTGYYSMGVANNTLKLYSSSNYPFGQDEVQSVFLTQIACAKPVIAFDYTTGQVTISTATAGATIHYTTDGTEPTTSSQSHSNPFTINSATTIKAIAVKTGFDNSEMAERTIEQVATPTIQNNGSNAVFITCATDGATIYYTTDGTTPNTSSTEYTSPLTDNVSNVTIKAIAVKENMITSAVSSGSVKLKCATPVITRDGMTFTLSCSMPSDAALYYTLGSGSEMAYAGTPVSFTSDQLPITVTAVARHNNYTQSESASMELRNGTGTPVDPYLIYGATDLANFVTNVNNGTTAAAHYKLATDVSASGIGAITTAFTGTFDGAMHTITGLTHPLFNTINGGTVKNVTLKGVNINSSLDTVGAITCIATGNSRIYNCGILPNSIDYPEGTHPTVTTSSNCAGGLVGSLRDNSRVINCYSYADVSASSTASSTAAGIVGNNNEATTMTNLKTMVMNCMFYGNITDASTKKPVYGGQIISNAGASGVNGYNYYRNGSDVTFDDNYSAFSDYYCSLPADEEYLTRFEYYRSIFNSNKRLCAWWIGGTSGTAPTDAEVEAVGLAKWVLDPETAPFPILKKWGKYPSVINKDPDYTWNPETLQKVSRASAGDYQGKKLGTISVTVNAGAKHAGNGATDTTLSTVVVTDMDTLNHDYGYYKIQLPYYNELFGDPNADSSTNWDDRYAGNYKDYVVTGWKITDITDGTAGSFKGYASTAGDGAVSAGSVSPDVTSGNPWEDGFNFADRNCTNKDLYSKSGRVFAQGGYYYVPEGVSDITIEAYWGKAVYLHNKDHYMERVNVAAQADGDGSGDGTAPDFGSAFTPAGTLDATFQGQTVRTTLQEAISNLPFTGTSYTVYDQAVVLVGNVQVKNRGGSLGRGTSSDNKSNNKPFTIMSCDLDFDNEPDYCLQFQQRNTTNRPGIHPIRFDFLPVPELGLAIRTNTFAYCIGLMVPQGHFEITETSFMHTTQFEYDAAVGKAEAPLILNGGHFEQIVVRYGPKDRTSYIIMGGNFRMKRFTPGYHASPANDAIRHCAVNAIGGEYPEFYLSGIYNPDFATRASDNPHCYTNGGYFGLMAGAGYEQVKGDVTFKIDHSIIGEFYGGGINGAKPVTGNIDVTINNSLVGKYCGGPKVGSMKYVDNGTTKYRTVTTNATGTTFGVFYGGGNGGTSYFREKILDNTGSFRGSASSWEGYNAFNPLNQVNTTEVYDVAKGYHAEYEFEVFNSSNGLKSGEDVIRVYYRWAQFGTTTTGNVTNTLTNCIVTGDFFGGGNLANVTGNVTSTLQGNTHVYGSAFAAGYSASIPSFPVHDKSTVRIPTHDASGNVDEQGSLDYYQDNGKDRMYTWCYKNSSGMVFPEGVVIQAGYSVGAKQKSVFRYPDEDGGKWYVLTDVSLENLGAVSNDATLIIKGNSEIGTIAETDMDLEDGTHVTAGSLIPNTGNVFGGGDQSAVTGNTQVILREGATIHGNVYGGGNNGPVGGNSEVKIQDPEP